MCVVIAWRRLPAIGNGWGWCGPTRTAHCWPAAPMTRQSVCGSLPPRSAKLSCGSTSMSWSVSPGLRRIPAPLYWRPLALRCVCVCVYNNKIQSLLALVACCNVMAINRFFFSCSFHRTRRVVSPVPSCCLDLETKPLRCGMSVLACALWHWWVNLDALVPCFNSKHYQLHYKKLITD